VLVVVIAGFNEVVDVLKTSEAALNITPAVLRLIRKKQHEKFLFFSSAHH